LKLGVDNMRRGNFVSSFPSVAPRQIQNLEILDLPPCDGNCRVKAHLGIIGIKHEAPLS
jgi:hypothetical protein